MTRGGVQDNSTPVADVGVPLMEATGPGAEEEIRVRTLNS